MSKQLLTEWSQNVESVYEPSTNGGTEKSLYLKGVCIQGDIRNANERIYPMTEIIKAVNNINDVIRAGKGSVLGECDHPTSLKINLDRVALEVTSMWVEGNCGYGKLKILSTPCGNIIRALITDGVKLGVSSRGSGNVNDNGYVSDFEILTVDAVAQPSAPNAYPVPVYEGIGNMLYGHKILTLAEDINKDPAAQKFLERELLRIIRDLRLK